MMIGSTNSITRAAMERAHEERSKAFVGFWRALFRSEPARKPVGWAVPA